MPILSFKSIFKLTLEKASCMNCNGIIEIQMQMEMQNANVVKCNVHI